MSKQTQLFSVVTIGIVIFGISMFALGQEMQKQTDEAAIVRYQSEGVAHMLENLKGTGFHLCKDGPR